MKCSTQTGGIDRAAGSDGALEARLETAGTSQREASEPL
jgi:hypothetical protein